MIDNAAESISDYLLAPVRRLRDACRQTGCDNDGARCPLCPVRDLCETDERWLVRGISSIATPVDLDQRDRRAPRDNATG